MWQLRVGEVLNETVTPTFGPAEHDGAFLVGGDALGDGSLVAMVGLLEAVRHRLDGRFSFFDPVDRWVGHASGKRCDGAVGRCGEQHHLGWHAGYSTGRLVCATAGILPATTL